MDVLQDLSHNIRWIITVFRDDGGNILSITKSELAQSCGCVSVQREFLRPTPETIVAIIERQLLG